MKRADKIKELAKYDYYINSNLERNNLKRVAVLREKRAELEKLKDE